MTRPLITGAWEKLIFINYEADPAILKKFIPKGTKIHTHNGKCYITLAGFLFSKIRIRNIYIPFHQLVPEINLRFYVIPDHADEDQRGVVFLREIISKPVMAIAANMFYREHYAVWPVAHSWQQKGSKIKYTWHQPRKQYLCVKGAGEPYTPATGSHEEFIMMQYFGFTKLLKRKTLRYRVTHPVWKIRNVKNYRLQVDFRGCFGKRFKFLSFQKPVSVFLAEGSSISIYPPEVL